MIHLIQTRTPDKDQSHRTGRSRSRPPTQGVPLTRPVVGVWTCAYGSLTYGTLPRASGLAGGAFLWFRTPRGAGKVRGEGVHVPHPLPRRGRRSVAGQAAFTNVTTTAAAMNANVHAALFKPVHA